MLQANLIGDDETRSDPDDHTLTMVNTEKGWMSFDWQQHERRKDMRHVVLTLPCPMIPS